RYPEEQCLDRVRVMHRTKCAETHKPGRRPDRDGKSDKHPLLPAVDQLVLHWAGTLPKRSTSTAPPVSGARASIAAWMPIAFLPASQREITPTRSFMSSTSPRATHPMRGRSTSLPSFRFASGVPASSGSGHTKPAVFAL